MWIYPKPTYKANGQEILNLKPIRQKKCAICKSKFTPFLSTQKVCNYKDSPECAKEYAKQVRERKEAKLKRDDAKVTRAAKKAMLTKSDWIKRADKVYNPWIRLRDKDDPCISCGRYEHEIENTYGGKWDCGHYLGKGAHPELRYEPKNSNKQCKSCNGGSGKYARKNFTVTKEYRERLIVKIGLDNVEWLEGPHEPKNYAISDLIEIEALYKRKLKEIS